MTEPEDLERLAALIGLALAGEHRAGVVENFARLMTQARLVTEFPLPDEVEPAAVFRP